MERRYAVHAWVIGWRRVFTRFSPDFTDRGEEGSRHAGIGITTITGSSATRKLQRQQPTANNRVRFNDRACWRMFKRALNATAWWERRFRPRGGKQIGGRRGGGSRNGSIENEQWRVSRNNRWGAEQRHSSGVGRNSGFHERYMTTGRNTINDSLGRALRLPVNFYPNFAQPPQLITDSGHTRPDPRNRKARI